jgi:CubicO group peptidase (beta-lactamase class C family)
MFLKKSALFIVVFLFFTGVTLNFIGITPKYIVSAPSMITGLSSKLACSSKYVSGISEAQTAIDLASYSSALNLTEQHFDDEVKRVTTSFFGLSSTSAQFRNRLGCTLYIGETNHLDAVKLVKPLAIIADSWPIGEQVETIAPEVQSLLTSVMQQDNRDGYNSRAMLVIKDGEIIAETYSPGFDSESQLLGWSMAKSVTAILLGHLEMKGMVSAKETDLFPEWSDDRTNISIENLLHMSSGLDFEEIYAPGEDATQMLFTEYDSSQYAKSAPLIAKPGERWLYASGSTNILTRIINERLDDGRHAALKAFHQYLFQPMAMRDSTFEPDPAGMPVGSSYMYASARDWARVGQLMLNGGTLNGHRIVTPQWVKRATTPNDSINEKAYGYQFWLNQGNLQLRWPDLPADSYAAMGNRKQVLMVLPSKNMVIVRLGWTHESFYPTNDNFMKLIVN